MKKPYNAVSHLKPSIGQLETTVVAASRGGADNFAYKNFKSYNETLITPTNPSIKVRTENQLFVQHTVGLLKQ